MGSFEISWSGYIHNHIWQAPLHWQVLFAPGQHNHLHPSLSSTVLQFEVKNTSFTSHFSPLGIANCGKTLPGGRFKGRRRKTRRSKNCHSSPYSHITTTLSHSIAKTEKTGQNRSKQLFSKNWTAPIPRLPSGKIYLFSNVSHQPKNVHDIDIGTVEKHTHGWKVKQFEILFMKHLPD